MKVLLVILKFLIDVNSKFGYYLSDLYFRKFTITCPKCCGCGENWSLNGTCGNCGGDGYVERI